MSNNPLEEALRIRKAANPITKGLDGTTGPTGATGPAGPAGADGATGPTGPAGVGIPAGGTAGQIIIKTDSTDYNTYWADNVADRAYAVEMYVKNNTGTTLTKGQVVYVSSANGANVNVSLAKANAESTSSKTAGFLKQTLNTGDHGYVIVEGRLTNINTNGLIEGDPVWLSPTTAGGWVTGLAAKPYAPSHLVYLGTIIRAHAVNGAIQVKVQNGFELDELHNVDLKTTSPTDGDVLEYNSATSLWKNVANYIKKTVANIFTAPQTFTVSSTTDVPVTIKGVASQTSNLLNLSNSADVSQFSINPSGYITAKDIQANGGLRLGSGVTYSTNKNWLSIGNAVSTPTTPTGGGIIYTSSGDLHYISSSGIDTNLSATSSVIRASMGFGIAGVANNAIATSSFTVSGKSLQIIKVVTNVAARIRIYGTAAQRDADISRVSGTDPATNSGCFLDMTTTSSALSLILSPQVEWSNLDTTPAATLYVSYTNLSGATSTIDATFTYLKTEG